MYCILGCFKYLILLKLTDSTLLLACSKTIAAALQSILENQEIDMEV